MTDRRHRQKEQRAAKKQAERKSAARRELGKRLGIALVFGFVVIGIFVVTSLGDSDEVDLPNTYEGFREQPTACGADQPPPETVMSFDAPQPQTDITAGSMVNAVLQTSCGEVVIELDPAGFPETVNSFVFLSREGFYDGQVFHRIKAGLVAQGGDPNANGTGGPGYVVPDEFPDDDFVYEEGVVAMANRGARSTGSQFFIVIGDDARFLTNNFSVLGRVVSGSDALARMAEVPKGITPGSNEQSLPLETVYIETVTIEVSGS